MEAEVVKVWNDMNDRLSNFVKGKVKDNELTKDIVQDVFLKVFSNIDTIRSKDKIVSWIFQIARNEVAAHYRKFKYTEDVKDQIEENDIDSYLTSELASWVRPVVDSLPDKYREALVLSDIEKVPQKEIAKRLKMSYSGVKSRVQRGREMLKSTCEQCCEISTDVYGNVIDYQQKKPLDYSDKNCDQ